MNQAESNIPFQPSPLSLIYKVFAGLIGGLIGSGSLLLVFTIASSILKPVLNKEVSGEIAPVFILVFMVMIFVASLAANLISNFLMGLSEREKYTRLDTTIFQTFLLNLVIFIFTAPIYLIVSHVEIASIAAIAGLQVVLSVMASSTVLEIVSNPKYSLIGVYTSSFGMIIGLLLITVFFQISGNQFVLMFAVLPVLWASIGFFNSMLNLVYFQLYKLYGVDFLSAQQSFGVDEEATQGQNMITEQEIYEATTKDEEGSEFLKK